MKLSHFFLPHPETHKKAHLLSFKALMVYILFFLLLSPNDSAGLHLAALERISTVIRDNDFRRFMREANGKAGMIEILKEVDGIHV